MKNFPNLILIFLLFSISYLSINSLLAFPFETVNIIQQSEYNISPEDYLSTLLQNELYINLTLASPKQTIKSILKMEKYGYLIYNDAYNYQNSSTYSLIDEDLKIQWVMGSNIYPSKEILYVPFYDSYNDFSNKYIKIIQTNETNFLRIEKKSESNYTFNNAFYTYGLIGLKINSNPYFNAPEFIYELKKTSKINKYIFSFKFNQNKGKNNLFNSNNNGYFIIGEELTDIEKNQINIMYTKAKEVVSEINWSIVFDNIYTKTNNNENNFTDFKGNYLGANLEVNRPFIIAPAEYFNYIYENFFKESIEKNICKNYTTVNEFSGYICDGNSNIILNNIKNKFPILSFENKEFNETFYLKGEDLFSYNMFSKNDSNIYFMIICSVTKYNVYANSWFLGTPFFKKYQLSFNYESKMIGYYKGDESNKNSGGIWKFLTNSIVVKIIIIILLIFGIFVLGMFIQKKLGKNQRKNRANELDDDNFDYNVYKNTDEKKNENNNEGLIGMEIN